MRLGKVRFAIEYTVDLDDQEMVDHAKGCIYEDVMSAVKFDEIWEVIKIIRDPNAKEEDIPSFLTEKDRLGEDEDEI